MIALAQQWLADYGRAAVVLSMALSLGYPIGRRFVRGPAAPALILLLGLAVLSLVLCLLAWARAFTSFGVIAIGMVGATASTRCLLIDVPAWRSRWRSGSRPSRGLLMCMAAIAIVLLAFSWFVLYPSTAFDATSYHLPLARDLLRNHGLRYDEFVRYSFFPQANESMFAVILMMSKNPASSAALEYSVLAAAALMLPLWFVGSGRHPGAGLAAGLVLLSSPVVIYAGTAAFVDTWTLTFVLGGTLAGLDAAEGRASGLPAFAVIGALIGEAAATKYTGAAYGACAVLGVLVAGRRRITSRAGLTAVGACGLIALPWYAWTLHTTGDPLYPFATGLFGSRHGLWTSAEIRLQANVARGIPHTGIGAILRRDLQYLGGGVPYDTGMHRSPLSWLLGAGFLGLLARSNRRDRSFLGVTAAAVLSIAVALVTSADPRYLVPGIAPLALLAGLAADTSLASLRRFAPALLRDRRLVTIWSAAAVVLGVWSAASYVREFHRLNGQPPTDARHVSSYLTKRIPCYAAVTYLNDHAGPDYRAWGYSCEQARYYSNGLLIGDAFSVGSRFRIFGDGGNILPTPRNLWARLQPLRVRWMLLPVQIVPSPSALDADGLFSLIGTLGPVDVFRVNSAPLAAPG